MRALGHHEELAFVGGGSLCEQVGLHKPSHVGIKRDSALLVAFADHPDPTSSDVDISDIETEHLGTAQTRKEHQSGHGSVPVRAQTGQQSLSLIAVKAPREPSRLAHTELGARPWLGQVTEHP